MTHIIEYGWYVFNPQKAGADKRAYEIYFRKRGLDMSAPYKATSKPGHTMNLVTPIGEIICVTSAYYDVWLPNKSVEDWL